MSTIKTLNKEIKEEIQINDKFKKFYNKLSKEERIDLKEKVLKYREFIQLILKYHNCTIDFLDEFCNISLLKHLKDKGYKKTWGKKARTYATGRSFLFKFESYYLSVIPYIAKKGYAFYTQYFLEIPSDKGTFYALVTSENSEDLYKEPIVLYTSHFFDRFRERMNIQSKLREVSIRHFVDQCRNTQLCTQVTDDQKTIMYLGKGLALGERISNITLNKTYISDSQLSDSQRETKEDLEESSETIEADVRKFLPKFK